jgi:hypothetical protein
LEPSGLLDLLEKRLGVQFGKHGRTGCHHQQHGNTRAQARPQPDAVGDPLAASRATLIRNVLPVPEAEVAEARKLYLERHANSKNWVDFDDFGFHQMNVVDVYYVGGFGVMGWVSAPEYYSSHSLVCCTGQNSY